MIARLALAWSALALATPHAFAASFDCAKASTPFETAICQNEALSRADDRLAKTFATAIGGLTDETATLMREEQRAWLGYAQRACTADAQPLTTGSYDADGAACLVDTFGARSTVLENSRMQGGHRFYLKSIYGAQQDPDQIGGDQQYWKVATHETVVAQLDADDPLAEAFNAWLLAKVDGFNQGTDEDGADRDWTQDPGADTALTIGVKEIGGADRISLLVNTFWYNHGGAHGDYMISYLHYYVREQREIVAEDIFAGADWQNSLASAAWSQLQIEHGEWLQVENQSDIADIVVDPARWDLDDDYGLIIQFEPYEVSSYAYGAPTITIPWTALDAIKAERQDEIRYSF